MKEAKEFAESIAAIFIETSARNAVNIEELFQKISTFPVFTFGYCSWVCGCILFGRVLRKVKGYLSLTNAGGHFLILTECTAAYVLIGNKYIREQRMLSKITVVLR